jgi:hypothetical protein
MQDKLFRKAALEKLSSPEELDQLMQVTTPRGWFALLGLIGLLAAAVVIGIATVIPVRTNASYCLLLKDNAGTISSVMYVPYRTGENRIEVGDEARMSVTERSGFVLGKVLSVGDFPVNENEIQTIVGSSTLAAQLLNENGSLIEVHVELSADESAPGNYLWSSGPSAPIAMESKLRCEAAITIDRKPAVQLILRGS